MPDKSFSEMVLGSDNIVFFGGAGVSTESGISDFRGSGGLYNDTTSKIPPEVILSHDYLYTHPAEFYGYYRSNMLYPGAKPNAAHIALARLEKAGRLKAVITQNIDGLHQLAGSRNVIELHGSSLRNYCIKCGKRYGLDYILSCDGVPKCEDCGGFVRPDVVMYGESLDSASIEAAVRAVSGCDMLIVGGTSLTVYPAAGFINYYGGNKLVIINRDPTPFDSQAKLVIRKSISEVFSKITRLIPE